MKELNINSLVQIPATDAVLGFLKQEHIKFWTNYAEQYEETSSAITFADKRIAEYIDPRVKNGMITLPLWDVMEKFGKDLCPGCIPLFVTILIDEKDLK
ncbi:hypothetical protein HWD28_gp137 [Salmonella phage atrejo]|uniref:Uncharacterized protein n=1 Tax=Salmonella phage atrejo TaxID=2713277 RepID=A0A6G8RK19_9CAUD|nr:hypothetical protein HWD28_gp137 [Salmonella phage atrejo]QIO01781.1 hypothetical protein atrejo_133 [Salmonella phage atrejo]